MDPKKRILCPVQHQGDELYIAGSYTDHGFSFWVERPAGKLWMHINERVGSVADIDPRFEIMALTAHDDGDFLSRIAMMSGWFARTGRSVRHPVNEQNEVWAVTETCRQMFAAIGIPIPTLSMSDTKSAPVEHATPAVDQPIEQILQGWMARLRDVHVTAVVVTVPDPFAQKPGSRLVVASYPEALRKDSIHFEVPAEGRGPQALADWRFLDHIPDARWSPVMQQHGFGTVVSLRIPIAQSDFLECLMFGPNRLFDNARAAISAWTALNVVPQLKEFTATAVCNLTSREREILISAFQGKTAVETAEQFKCTPRTVRFHLGEAMRKLRTDSTIGAIQRAQLLCII